MNKIRDDYGNVAVIINKGYGIGWSTFGGEYQESLMYDGAIVNMVLAHTDGFEQEITQYCRTKYPDFYCIAYDLDVVWVKPGRPFFVEEYDGHESICYIDTLNTFTA
jgi:hypothetical protein